MKIFVLIKQVPDTETKIKIAPDGCSIDTTGIKWVMNPYDEFAVEEAVKTRDLLAGSQVWVLTAGPSKRTTDSLRTALAMGADEAISVDTSDAIDAFQTAQILSEAIKKEGGAQLIFAGKLAIDDNQGAVPQMVASFLGIHSISVVSKLKIDGSQLLAERDIEGGAKEIFECKMPALIAANKGLNMPRYASLPGIMKAKKKQIKEYNASSLGVTGDAKTKITKIDLPAEKPAVKLLTGDSALQASLLVQALRDEAKVL
jgi:electron transfer flavoprotein beta subunit